jgi:biopolymer transport protein ExbD
LRKRREHISPDLTPLIDVIFLLLIFFIVTSVFKKDELALMLNLPTSNAKEITIDQKEITLELSKDKLAYNGKIVKFDNIKEELLKIKDKKRAIIVRVDKKVEYQRVVKLLDILQQSNLNSLSLVTDK